jgi:hypothetical protein
MCWGRVRRGRRLQDALRVLFIDEVMPGDRRQVGGVRRSWLQVHGHGPALRRRDPPLLSSLRVDDKVPRWQHLQRPDGLHLREVVVHVDLTCEFFLYDLYSVLVDHFLHHRWVEGLRHTRLMLGRRRCRCFGCYGVSVVGMRLDGGGGSSCRIPCRRDGSVSVLQYSHDGLLVLECRLEFGGGFRFRVRQWRTRDVVYWIQWERIVGCESDMSWKSVGARRKAFHLSRGCRRWWRRHFCLCSSLDVIHGW